MKTSKYIVISCVLFFCTTFLIMYALENKQFYKIYNVLMDYETDWSNKNKSTTIPFYVSKTGHIYLKSNIKNEEKYLVFDTGADYTMVNEKYNGNDSIHFINTKDSQALNDDVPIHKLDRLLLGDLKFHQLSYGALKKETWGDCGIFHNQDSIVGILGNNIINSFVWDLDMVNHQMRITDASFLDTIAKSKVIPLIKNGMGWNVEIKLNGMSKNIKLDSGSNSILSITDSIKLAKMYTYPIINAEKSIGFLSYKDCKGKVIKRDSLENLNKKTKEARRIFANLGIADTIYKNTFVVDKSKSNLLGNPLFWEYERVVLDFINKKMYLINPNQKRNIDKISTLSKEALFKTRVTTVSKFGYYEMYYENPIALKTKSKSTQDTLIFNFKDKAKIFASIERNHLTKEIKIVIDSILGKGYVLQNKSKDSIKIDKSIKLNVYENTPLNDNDFINKL
ncbi:pepsin/retropepsin-like aspartic protease family protein [Flavivirga rizhaonensis]|uniref:Peptidase A2 domain-containing protein n=1 Tax=Flavivirga rizhaonensis TaxID=2559571 RepID=A0A4S1DW74_9FLAO|nr:hypothetical protein [Flavivirga rizhaonensis]TGV02380.1 hypothetical protein EM932_11625 [Flavivirga rizhaonensis]